MSATAPNEEVQRWLRYAQEDLSGAEAVLTQPRFIPRHICWLAQQAVEKALKAILIYQGVDFPRRHDLDALRNLVSVGWQVKDRHPDLAMLTEWAVEARYPGDWPDATEEDARSAVREARSVWETIRSDFLRRGLTIEEEDPLDSHENRQQDGDEPI